jgi:hypothetical protein
VATGVAASIESDVDNLVNLMTLFNIFPRGLYVKEAVAVAKQELALECDYSHEARCQSEYHTRLSSHAELRKLFVVPQVVPELCSKKVITGEWLAGVPIDRVKGAEQPVRDAVGSALMQLSLQARSRVPACFGVPVLYFGLASPRKPKKLAEQSSECWVTRGTCGRCAPSRQHPSLLRLVQQMDEEFIDTFRKKACARACFGKIQRELIDVADVGCVSRHCSHLASVFPFGQGSPVCMSCMMCGWVL